MRTVSVRAPECGGDNFTALKNNLLRLGRELSSGEEAVLELEAEAFPFAAPVLNGLTTGAGLELLEAQQAGATRTLRVRRP